jgi:hypothetical protein
VNVAITAYLQSVDQTVEEHPIDLDTFLADPSARPKVIARPIENPNHTAMRRRLSARFARTLAYLAK